MIALVGNATLFVVAVSLFLATVNLSKTRR